MGALRQQSNSHPLLLIFSHVDLFMSTPGSEDPIPFTTSGLDFHSSAILCLQKRVTWMSGQMVFDVWRVRASVCADVRGGFLVKSYSCIHANDAGISWFLQTNTPLSLTLWLSPPPIPHSLQLH